MKRNYTAITLKVCSVCGAEFIDDSRTQIRATCSDECADIRKRGYVRDYKARRYQPKELGTFICGRCGEEYPKTGKRQYFCPACQTEKSRERNRAVHAASKVTIGGMLVCACGATYIKKSNFHIKCKKCADNPDWKVINQRRKELLDNAERLEQLSGKRSPAKRDCQNYDSCLTEAALAQRPDIKCGKCRKYARKEIYIEPSIPCSLEADGFYAFGGSGTPAQCDW